MDAETYKTTLNDYDAQISELEKSIRDLRSEISEAEAAKENAKGIRNDFDSFVERRKQRNCEQTRGMLVKSFSTFIAKATSLLTGPEYHQANERIEEIDRLLSSKIKRLHDDLEYCKRELSNLKQRRNATYSEYLVFLKSHEEEAD